MTRRCGRALYPDTATCDYPRMKGKQRCEWHWLLAQPADVQAARAGIRQADAIVAQGGPNTFQRRARVAPEEWPPGERWCAGCQSFVPLFYTSGSRCKACASSAAHAQRVEKVYGITAEEYAALLKLQGGRCFICHRVPRTKRLAVDHDHASGAVRGLLCASDTQGCNRAVVGNLEAAADGGLAAARRVVEYLEDPPYARLQRGEVPVAHPTAPRPSYVDLSFLPTPTETPPF